MFRNMYQVEEILNIIFLVYLFTRPLNLLFKNYNQHIHINRLYYCLVDEEKQMEIAGVCKEIRLQPIRIPRMNVRMKKLDEGPFPSSELASAHAKSSEQDRRRRKGRGRTCARPGRGSPLRVSAPGGNGFRRTDFTSAVA